MESVGDLGGEVRRMIASPVQGGFIDSRGRGGVVNTDRSLPGTKLKKGVLDILESKSQTSQAL
jgi:hypothetical protein